MEKILQATPPPILGPTFMTALPAWPSLAWPLHSTIGTHLPLIICTNATPFGQNFGHVGEVAPAIICLYL